MLQKNVCLFGLHWSAALALAAVGFYACRPDAPQPPRIGQIQGPGHTSPMIDRQVAGITGVVTAVSTRGERGFWMQDPQGDGDPLTSDAIFVSTGDQVPEVVQGDGVRVDGEVMEIERSGQLGITALASARVQVEQRRLNLPSPEVLGTVGRVLPDQIDDDGLQLFEPDRDAIDLLESLEGMRVMVERALVVGPTSKYGEIVVLAGGGEGSSPRSARGGLLIRPGDVNPERLVIDDALVADPPPVRVGDQFSLPVVGVLHYGWGSFRIYNTEPLPEVIPGGLQTEVTELCSGPGVVTVATFNVENLWCGSAEEKLDQLGWIVAHHLGGPDLVALQEVQDDSGPADDGTVAAEQTMTRLVEAIVAAGGRHYDWRQVDPADNADGGMPGGNIRVALLFDPQVAGFGDRGSTGSRDTIEVEPGPTLSLSPGLVAPNHAAFAQDEAAGFRNSRKPMAAQLRVGGKSLFVVVNHLSSKGGDDRLFGSVQPPRRQTEAQRREQARVVRAFVEQLLVRDHQARVIVLGDLNEFEFRPPLAELRDRVLVNLMDRLPEAERYTYVYQGNSQVLDHILVSRSLAAAAEIDVVHVNAEFPDSERASDHDPVLARFRIGATGVR